jgi:DNA-binding transcriptional MerR regulator
MVEIVTHSNTIFSLTELSEAVENSLAEQNLLEIQQDNRISAAPDARTIRYYTSLQLLDRPKIVGRQAFYGERHLLQLLAIKALQAMSLPLSEIQARLYGSSNQELIAILAAISGERAKRPTEVRLVRWREVDIEVGLKLLAEENWNLKGVEPSTLTEKIKSAIAVLTKANCK